ncbi:MAG: hypothetical protein CEE38_04295 [Planctomycetes bacterium B3_Pla]|nr:MAG: hypothetical protein CEE38_04295 [Planctomycetes bacterium B3_Pla]
MTPQPKFDTNHVMEKVYIETSFVSFLSSKPSRNLLAAAWQQVSLDWWEHRRILFDLYTSELVIIGPPFLCGSGFVVS